MCVSLLIMCIIQLCVIKLVRNSIFHIVLYVKNVQILHNVLIVQDQELTNVQNV